MPELIEEAGFKERFIACFELAEELYVEMQLHGHQVEAQYATLLGHRMRYSFVANLRELYHMLQLRTGPDGHPGYRKICFEIYDLVKEVHPQLASGMKFIGQREDPELLRLAAETATLDKLNRLDGLTP